jgi:exo-1,4-beta-D-glucosaminidase
VPFFQMANRIAFFAVPNHCEDKGEEILPITYTNNYLTVMPLESRTIVAAYGAPSIQEQADTLRIDGYNVNAQSLPLG